VPVLLAGCFGGGTREQPSKPEEIPDAVPKQEPRSKYGNPKSYEVFGKRYFVLATGAGYVERGVASWYGPGFHGKRTSSGEEYDMHAMTAAHKTLPLPCYVQVTNLTNGRTAVVRVNDRGPFKDTRIIDLSRAAAEKLDVIRTGTAMVEVRVVENAGPGPQPHADTPAPALPKALYIQAGAFADQSNADRLVAKLNADKLGPAFTRRDTVGGRTLHRVRIGPISSVDDFDRRVKALKDAGVGDAHLALD
jgi:rare lipoprotein A